MSEPTTPSTNPPELLDLREVMRRTKLSRSTIYALKAVGLFPQPVRVGTHAVRWISAELDDWIATRPRAAGTRRPKR